MDKVTGLDRVRTATCLEEVIPLYEALVLCLLHHWAKPKPVLAVIVIKTAQHAGGPAWERGGEKVMISASPCSIRSAWDRVAVADWAVDEGSSNAAIPLSAITLLS